MDPDGPGQGPPPHAIDPLSCGRGDIPTPSRDLTVSPFVMRFSFLIAERIAHPSGVLNQSSDQVRCTAVHSSHGLLASFQPTACVSGPRDGLHSKNVGISRVQGKRVEPGTFPPAFRPLDTNALHSASPSFSASNTHVINGKEPDRGRLVGQVVDRTVFLGWFSRSTGPSNQSDRRLCTTLLAQAQRGDRPTAGPDSVSGSLECPAASTCTRSCSSEGRVRIVDIPEFDT
jgi:hypothetical protein